MRSFLAKCAAVGIVAGGFTLTGDVGRLAAEGRRLIDATGVPADRSPGKQAAAPTPDGAAAAPARASSPATPALTPAAAAATPARPTDPPAAAGTRNPGTTHPRQVWRLPGDAPADAPVGGGRVTTPLPASGGVRSVDMSRLASGTRILVWVSRSHAAGSGHGGPDVIALDVIDPKKGESLEHRHPATGAAGRGPIHAAPRRVRVSSASLSRGQPLRLAPLRGVHGPGPEEEIGRVEAIEVTNP